MRIKSLNLLLAFLMLFFASCQKESLTVMDEAGAVTSLAAKNLKAARVISSAENCATCIDAANPVYYPETGIFEGTYGSNTKEINYTVYNTLTGFEVELTYTRSSGKAATAVEVSVGSQTTVLLLTIPQSGTTTIKHTFDLPDGWDSCDELTWSIKEISATIGDVSYTPSGTPITGSGTYYLHAECVACDESFSYITNEDGSYTFTYIPEEDVEDAELVFTFAQGVAVTGLEDWITAGQTKHKVMDLEACDTYSWTVTLTPDCSGSSNNSNVWTDFKVGILVEGLMQYSSKKGTNDNIIIPCPE